MSKFLSLSQLPEVFRKVYDFVADTTLTMQALLREEISSAKNEVIENSTIGIILLGYSKYFTLSATMPYLESVCGLEVIIADVDYINNNLTQVKGLYYGSAKGIALKSSIGNKVFKYNSNRILGSSIITSKGKELVLDSIGLHPRGIFPITTDKSALTMTFEDFLSGQTLNIVWGDEMAYADKLSITLTEVSNDFYPTFYFDVAVRIIEDGGNVVLNTAPLPIDGLGVLRITINYTGGGDTAEFTMTSSDTLSLASNLSTASTFNLSDNLKQNSLTNKEDDK